MQNYCSRPFKKITSILYRKNMEKWAVPQEFLTVLDKHMSVMGQQDSFSELMLMENDAQTFYDLNAHFDAWNIS